MTSVNFGLCLFMVLLVSCPCCVCGTNCKLFTGAPGNVAVGPGPNPTITVTFTIPRSCHPQHALLEKVVVYRITNSSLPHVVCQFIPINGTRKKSVLLQQCSYGPVSGEYTVRISDGGRNWEALRVVASFDKSQEDIEDTLDIHRAIMEAKMATTTLGDAGSGRLATTRKTETETEDTTPVYVILLSAVGSCILLLIAIALHFVIVNKGVYVVRHAHHGDRERSEPQAVAFRASPTSLEQPAGNQSMAHGDKYYIEILDHYDRANDD